MRHIINSLLASMLLVGCTTDVDLGVAPAPTLEPFYASIEGSTTRTYVGEGDKLLWSSGDRVTVFNGNTTPLEYQFAGDNGAESGALNPVSPASVDSGTTLSANYAIYPHSASTTITDEGVINYTIPATQTYAANSFGLGANVMVAVSEDVDDRNFAFKNVGGYFEFSLYGEGVTVKSIVFSGNNDEKLAGDATITATYGGTPSIIFANDAMTALTLDCGEGVELGTNAEQATKFWLVVPAMTYTNGITITIIDTDGKVMQKTTSNPITINRSTVQPLAAFEVETTPIPTTQIWYTSTNGEVVTHYFMNSAEFGASIVSNVYKNGRGIITFDGDVTSIGSNELTGSYAFGGCSSLKSISLPESVTSIGNQAFDGCSSLESITLSEGVQSIGNYAFSGCSSLESITIPSSVAAIGAYAFRGCSKLKSITIPEGVASITNNTFQNCSSLESITLPSSVTTIGMGAFNSCSSLESVTLPDGVNSIGEEVFMGCSSLKSIIIPNNSVSSIARRVFKGCSALENITLSEGVQSIGDEAFIGCSSLESITLPQGVTSVGREAFSGCSNLQSTTLPQSITSIGENAFYGCGGELTVNYNLITSFDIDVNFDMEVTGGNGSVFSSANFTQVTIGEGVTTIGRGAFWKCSSLESITIPSSVTTIGSNAFRDCSSLESITIPEGVESIDEDTFSGCSLLKSVTIPDSVLSIGNDAFKYCSSLKSVTIPDSVLSIGNNAFKYCSLLESITIPNSVTSIGDSVFYGCSSLTIVTLPENATAIPAFMFNYCSSLESITIPAGVQSIGRYAFCDCSSLTTIYCKPTTPPTLYEEDAFSGTELTKIYVPASSAATYKEAQYWSEYAEKIEGYDFSN